MNTPVLVTAFLLVTLIAYGGMVLSAILHLANVRGGTWREDITPFAHRTAYLFPLALALLLMLLASPATTFPYYATKANTSPWLHFPFLAAREIAGLLLGAAASIAFVRASVRHDRRRNARSRNRLTALASTVLALYVLHATMLSWDFEMTLTPHFHSAMFAPMFFVSGFQMFLAFFVVAMYAVRVTSDGASGIGAKSFNYLAQMMLGFTLLWTYTFFGQFITIWYAGLPDETERLFALMFEHADIRRGPSEIAVLFWWSVALKSFIPFLLLIFAVFRRTPALTAGVGAVLVTGSFLERFTWEAAAYPTWSLPLPDLLGLAVVGALCAAVFFVLRAAAQPAAPTVPAE